MRVILYKTKHGATRKIGKVINQYLHDCLLMNIENLDYPILQKADMIIIGVPVYSKKSRIVDISKIFFICHWYSPN